MNNLEQKIELLLFYKNEPLSFSWLAKQLEVDKTTIEESLPNMQKYYIDRGVNLVLHENTAALVTNISHQEIIQQLLQQDEQRELSKQALETLAIIAYKGKITKSEIDYIRGVNSVFILRNLLVRGLITKKSNILDKRSPLYVITPETLSFLNITDKKDLPNAEVIYQKLDELESDFNKDNAHQSEPTDTEDLPQVNTEHAIPIQKKNSDDGGVIDLPTQK